MVRQDSHDAALRLWQRTETQIYVSIIAKIKNGERPRAWEVKSGGVVIGKIHRTDNPRQYRLVSDEGEWMYEGSRVGAALTMAALAAREDDDD